VSFVSVLFYIVFVVCVSFGELECNTVLSCCYRTVVLSYDSCMIYVVVYRTGTV
jgi:hypothetical protein